ncbi:MAG: hypothetical protein M1816_001577 [Peltula sp. TS41687]|nr:MAG: hypothetical protein M1816_001577 [Peltula sp. TS41687]
MRLLLLAASSSTTTAVACVIAGDDDDDDTIMRSTNAASFTSHPLLLVLCISGTSIVRFHPLPRTFILTWLRLLRSCGPGKDLSTCSGRIILEGWEQRREFCPWCDEEGSSKRMDRRWFRLIGSDSNPSTSGRGWLPKTIQPDSAASDADDEMEKSAVTKRLAEKRAKQRERSLQQKRAFAAYLPADQANLTQENAMITLGADDPLPPNRPIRDVVRELMKREG